MNFYGAYNVFGGVLFLMSGAIDLVVFARSISRCLFDGMFVAIVITRHNCWHKSETVSSFQIVGCRGNDWELKSGVCKR
jgi:hypothetical protein